MDRHVAYGCIIRPLAKLTDRRERKSMREAHPLALPDMYLFLIPEFLDSRQGI